jgi:formylglycine-generating enzyme required for sulfatase activity
MSKYEITQAQWVSVMQTNPSVNKGENRPVEMVAKLDIQEFIAKLNSRNDGYRYRLPTEAEWEYAARAERTRQTADLSNKLRGLRITLKMSRIRSARKSRMRGDFTTCKATSGKSFPIFIRQTTTASVQLSIQRVLSLRLTGLELLVWLDEAFPVRRS